MKICPRCNKTYTDDNLNFCLDDGTVLEQAGAGAMPETVLLTQPRPTSPQQQMPSQQYPTQPPSQAGWNTAPQQYAQPPKKSSKTWIWVLLILGAVALVCGGGVVGLIIWGASQADNVANTTTNSKTTSPSPSKSTTTTTKTTSTTTDRTKVENVDLNEWVRDFSAYGNTEFTGGEFIMSSKQKGFYYVLAAPADTAQTENANTKVTVRNMDDGASRLGYGIVFHSNPTPLQQGYAFLIDAKNKKYRVVHHSPQKEDPVVAWTKSDAIKDGTSENTLEVRDMPDKVELYINGQMVTSIKNVYGYKGGVVGLYSGDAVKTAFKDLQISR